MGQLVSRMGSPGFPSTEQGAAGLVHVAGQGSISAIGSSVYRELSQRHVTSCTSVQHHSASDSSCTQLEWEGGESWSGKGGAQQSGKVVEGESEATNQERRGGLLLLSPFLIKEALILRYITSPWEVQLVYDAEAGS